MKKTLLTFVLLVAAALGAVTAAQAPDRDALKARIEQRYDVVPIANGIALTPKNRRSDVRLIEISDTIAVNGAVVSGAELRERLGADAATVIQLSYLDAAALREMFPPPTVALPEPPDTPAIPAEPGRTRAHGDRVRVFGSVRVDEDEEVTGQAVAVFGNVTIDGEVNDQVVAVFGNVNLGPKAIVRGDIVSVGGRVNKSPTAQVRGGVTEVAVGRVELPGHMTPWLAGVGLFSIGDGPFAAVPRLIASMFRLLLMVILASTAYLLARRTVENSAERIRENPAKATFIGVAAALLIGPILFMTTIVLVLTVIGIPLLVLMPVAIIFIAMMGLAGFSGTALALGQWGGRRFGMATAGFGTVIFGVIIILTPVLIARIIALGGWATAPFALIVAALAFVFELMVWCVGFGAVLSNTMAGWQARRAARVATVTPAP